MTRRQRILPILLFPCIAALWFAGLPLPAAGGVERTALDEYAAAPDDSYSFRLVKQVSLRGMKVSVLEMTSQKWAPAETMRPKVWKHWLVLYQPREVTPRTALLMIGGGSNRDEPPSRPSPRLAEAARAMGSVAAELRMVPNQPLIFEGDPHGPRSEDAMIAYAWDRFIHTGDPLWLPRLPMTKAVVRAMDTVTSFLEGGQGPAVDRFMVTGGSKRGWTAWTTAAVDERVVAVCPIVIDLLNLKPSMIHHYRAYGFWAPAIRDYYEMGLMDQLDHPNFEKLLEIVEPYSYRERLTMPKFILNSAGDQFFLPDSSQFYFEDLPGEKYLRYVPNSDHSLRDTDAFQSLIAFYGAVLRGEPRPEFSWSFEDDGSIRVTTQTEPAEVKLWQAANPEHRDFRLEAVGPAYKSRELEPEAEGVYVARVEKPEKGWKAFFVELSYPSGGKYRFKFTTAVRVIPGAYPHAEPEKGRTRVGRSKQQ